MGVVLKKILDMILFHAETGYLLYTLISWVWQKGNIMGWRQVVLCLKSKYVKTSDESSNVKV